MANDAEIVDKLVAALTQADENFIHNDGYTQRDYASSCLLPALRRQGLLIAVKPTEEISGNGHA